MQNIVNYFNSLLSYIFGPNFFLKSFNNFVSDLYQMFSPSRSLEEVLIDFFRSPSFVFSAFVWSWFAWLSIHLLLIWPFKWIRSVVTRK